MTSSQQEELERQIMGDQEPLVDGGADPGEFQLLQKQTIFPGGDSWSIGRQVLFSFFGFGIYWEGALLANCHLNCILGLHVSLNSRTLFINQ